MLESVCLLVLEGMSSLPLGKGCLLLSQSLTTSAALLVAVVGDAFH